MRSLKSTVPVTLAVFMGLFAAGVNAEFASAQNQTETQATKPAKELKEINVGYLRAYAPQLALSVLDVPPRDEGVAGANVAITDNNTTGAFTGQKFNIETVEVKPDEDVTAAFDAMLEKGDRYVLTDLSAEQLLSIADKAREKGVLLFNVGNTDDSLREDLGTLFGFVARNKVYPSAYSFRSEGEDLVRRWRPEVLSEQL